MTTNTFRTLRRKIGTQARVAQLMGVHVQSVVQWESGARPIPPARAGEIRALAKNPPPLALKTPTSVVVAESGSTSDVTIRRHDGTTQHLVVPHGVRIEIVGDKVVVDTKPLYIAEAGSGGVGKNKG